jgi:hypothetical protein
MMKSLLKPFLAVIAFTMGANVANAQDQDEEITNEQLERYAIAMDSVERMKQEIIDMMTTEVEENEDITGGRFNELSKIIEDSVKLAEANATQEEIDFILSVKEKKDQMTADINITFKTLAIDYIGDGGRIYKRIRTALRTDEEVKERYEDIIEELKEEAEDEAEDAEDAAADLN